MHGTPPPTRPIIVCGMPRTGTSLLGQFVKKSGDLVLFPELSPEEVPALFDLLHQTRTALEAATWRGFAEDAVDARVLELLRRVWAAGRPLDEAEDPDLPRFGLKQPNAELAHERFHEALRGYPPLYLYTVRDPVAVYGSLLRMAVGGDVAPREFLRRLEASLDAAAAIARAEPEALSVVDVDRVSGDRASRLSAGRRLFDRLGLPWTRKAENFLVAWPAVNRGEGNRGDLTDGEIERRVADLAGSRRLTRLRDRMTALVAG